MYFSDEKTIYFVLCLRNATFTHSTYVCFVVRQPIYVALAVLVAQAVLFVSIFEWGRRNKLVASVFDRRRLVMPDRCPPPLPMRYFAWWSFQINANEWQNEKLLEEDIVSSSRNSLDPFVCQAEQECYEESPFFDPNVCLTESTDEVVECETTEEEKDELELSAHDDNIQNIKHRRRKLTSNNNKTSMGRHTSDGTEETAIRSSSSSGSPARIRRNVSQSSLASKLRERERSPFTPRRRRRNRSGSRTQAERLAQLRFAPSADETQDWLSRSLSRACRMAWAFVKKYVLLIREEFDDEEGESSTPHEEMEGTCDEVAAHKVTRRPLTKKQQELLRCVGVDAFMTLRFLDFGFRVSFWPLLLSIPTLMPLYRTGKGSAQIGFYSMTILSLAKDSWRSWVVGIFAFVQYLYILRQIWIEWEIFLPLRFDFLEHGDFSSDPYQDQYRKTCLVEHIPSSQRRDSTLFAFFDAVFPDQIKRAEVLLNTERLRSLLSERQHHVTEYENGYARKVHKRAKYLRNLSAYNNLGAIQKHMATIPRRPKEPQITVDTKDLRGGGAVFFSPHEHTVRHSITVPKLQWHHE